MRIFAGDKVKSLMERMGMPDDEPIEHPWVSKSIQDAQRKVEAHNFDIRKNLLEYDDVMNEQRKTVYKIRQQLLLGIYTPEILDDEGKGTGKMRAIEPLERLRDDVKPQIEDMLLSQGTPMPKPGEEVKRPKKDDEIKEL
jgi:preprotein translocase subunit SecA